MLVAIDGKRVLETRRAKSIPAGDLSKISGVSIHTIEEIEGGQRPRVQERTLFALAKALEVELKVLEAPAKEEAQAGEHPAPAGPARAETEG
jgi:transcriptional regulator with XRE-family HTH domain